ncbi:hypothetical protein GPJ56_001454 [Histomonas meleagridis]|uniref:uncharacterized protein n=1 Tax=Histomonas meleagridis TaxID=135588 RepID=UPI003559C16C|nr:hypothetical protein GPJ56_001454 [Histomonas meleagridis]KAH0798215.1 hypothetical protein GO595_009061 [Histomonas meleagridis]
MDISQQLNTIELQYDEWEKQISETEGKLDLIISKLQNPNFIQDQLNYLRERYEEINSKFKEICKSGEAGESAILKSEEEIVQLTYDISNLTKELKQVTELGTDKLLQKLTDIEIQIENLKF